ncbi:MAG: tetratricopeptide repeat protein [Spirochaetales bacterium]|nr:tetratricopeptide repeat protein [Spirochaetales bacterium]
MKYNVFTGLLFLLLMTAVTVAAQSGGITKTGASLDISLLPEATIPILGSGDIFEIGVGGRVAVRFSPVPLFFFDFEGGYNFSPVRAEMSASRQWGGVGGGIGFTVSPGLTAGVVAGGGGFYTFVNEDPEQNGGHGYAGGGVFLDWKMFNPLHLKGEVGYRYFFGYAHELSVSIGLSYAIDFVIIKALEQGAVTIGPVFPVLINTYDNTPVGSTVIRNKEKSPVKDLSVSLYIPAYMDKAVKCADIKQLDGGESIEVALSGKFRDNLMGVEELSKAKTEIRVSYSYEGNKVSEVFRGSAVIHNRNNILWDKPSKLGLFVTSGDPRVSAFALKASEIPGNTNINNIDTVICKAMILFESLNIRGIASTGEYHISKTGGEQLDTVLYPYQVLETGVCNADEAVFLYCALLEAAGIPSAIIRFQDRIMPAFLLSDSAAKADKIYSHPGDLIVREEGVFLPVDTSVMDSGFLRALQSGVMAWNNASRNAVLLPIEAMQREFPPPPLTGSAGETGIPSAEALAAAFGKRLDEFVAYEMAPRVEKLEADAAKAKNSAVVRNRLGVLYAEYGRLEKAMEIFNAIVLKEEYVPALINMGTAYYMKDELIKAIPYFERALKMAPLEPVVLLSLAIINHRLENYGNAREAYKKLQSIDPELAEQYSYIELKGDEARLAAEVSREREKIIWISE